MRTSERLRKLKQWIENELCEGREMKTPAPDMDITKIVRQKPQCFLAWQPTRPDETGVLRIDPINVCPGILIMPRLSNAKYVEEKRFDPLQQRTQTAGTRPDTCGGYSVQCLRTRHSPAGIH